MRSGTKKRIAGLFGCMALMAFVISIAPTVTGPCLAALLLANSAADSEGNEEPLTTMVSWNANEITLASSANDREKAKRSAVIWLVEEHILMADIADIWRPELRRVFSRPDRYVLSLDAREDAYYIKLSLTQIMRDLVTLFFGRVTPRIAVCTEEVVLRRAVPDPAVQTAIANALNTYGFQVVDREMSQRVLYREAGLQSISGDPAGMKSLAARLSADILVLGDSFAEEYEHGEGFGARVEFRVVEGDTGRVLASMAETHHVKTAPSPMVAAKQALQKGAEASRLKLCSEMLNTYGMPVIIVNIWKLRSLDQYSTVIAQLNKALPGAVITPQSLDLRASGSAVLAVSSKNGSAAVAQALEKTTGVKLKVTAMECRSLSCEVRP